MVLVKLPEEQKDLSDEIKNAGSPTEDSAGSPTTPTDTPAAPMTKGQKKKAAAAAKKAAARANDSSPSQSPPPEDVDTTSDPEANTTMTQPPSDESGVSKPLDDTPTSAPVQDLEGNAWGLNEDEPAVPSDDLTKPTMSDAPVSDAQDSGSADDPQSSVVPNNDKTSESVPPPPTGEAPSDALPNASNELPNPDTSDLPDTKIDPVNPSRAVAVDEHNPNEDTTRPNGMFNCEPMDLPPRPSDDDNTPLAQIAGRGVPSINTNVLSDGLVNGGARKQTPGSAGENLGSAQFGPSSHTTATGAFSNSPARPNAPSISPTSGVPARGPGAVGFGSAAPSQTPPATTTTSGFNFGFGSPQKSTPKNASGMSWGAPSPASASSKPAKSAGWSWSGLANKARETFEQAIGDEQSPAPGPTQAPTVPPTSTRAPPARSPSVERPAQSPAVGPTNSNSNSDAVPSPNRPTRGMTSFEAKMAALKQKAATGRNKDSPSGPNAEAETPKTPSLVIPPSISYVSPISPSVSTQSHTQAQPLPLPLPTSMTSPTEQNTPQTPNQAMVTSAFSSPPRESTAETGKVGKPVAIFDNQEAPIGSKVASTGLRLQTQPPPVPDRRRSESPVTKRDSNASETERPSLADMRSTSAPLPRTPINGASPRTPGSFGFGPGLGTTSRFNSRFSFGGGGLGGIRSGPGPSPMSTPVGEKNEARFENHRDDDLSSVVEGSEPNDLDSQVGESDNQDLDSLVDESGAVGLPELSIDVESPTIPTMPTAFRSNIPVTSLPGIKPFVMSPPPITPPPATFEVTAPLPSPTRSELEPGAITPDDKTIADPSDLAEIVPELVPKDEVSNDEPQAESVVVDEPVLTPVKEEPASAVPPTVEEPVESPVVEKPVAELAVDEVVEPVVRDETPVPEPTEALVPEPIEMPMLESPVDEPPLVLSTEPAPEPPADPVAEVVVESIPEPTEEFTMEPTTEPTSDPTPAMISNPTSEAIPEAAPEPTIESVVELAPETPVEPTPEPVADPVTEPTEAEVEAEVEAEIGVQVETELPKPIVELPVEPISEPAVEAVAVAPALETPAEASSQPLPVSPIEAPAVEPIPVVETNVPADKSAAPKLSIDVPRVADSSKLKSPLPPTPATPATPITPSTPAKKKKKKAKKGAAVNEPVPTIPETISEPTPESEPTSKPEPVSVSEPISWPLPRPEPASLGIKPPWNNAKVESVAEPAPTVEVPTVPETLKEPEPTPEVVEDTLPKEEPASPTETKKQKKKKGKRKSSAALTQVTSPADDVSPTSEEMAEQSETKPIESVEPVVVEPVMVEPDLVEHIAAQLPTFESTMPDPSVVAYATVESQLTEPEVIKSMIVEPEVAGPELAEPTVVEPPVVGSEVPELVVEATPSVTVGETIKSEDNHTAVPDEGFETPKVVPQELPEPAESFTEQVAEPIEVVPRSLMVEPIIVPPMELVPEPALVPPPVESSLEPSLVFEAQSEPEVEPIVTLVTEPTAESVVTAAPEPVIQPIFEPLVESAPEQGLGFFSEPTMEVAWEPAVASPVEQTVVETVQSPTEPTFALASELQIESSTEPIAELMTSPVVEEPKEEPPVLEAKETPSPSKSSKKKNKRKGTTKATVIAEALVSTSTTDEPVVEVAKSEPLRANADETKFNEEIAAVPSQVTSKKKGKKAKAVTSVPTPVDEKVPVFPLPSEAPAPIAIIDTPQLEEMEEVLVTTAPSIKPFEPLLQSEVTPKIEVTELPNDQSEATPKIEVIELADDQYAEATSTISVAQMPYDDTVPFQFAASVVEPNPIDPAPEVPSESEVMPVLVDLPQSPATSVPSVVSSPPRSIISSPQPPLIDSVARGISPPPRSVTPSTTKHDDIHEVLPMPVIFAPSPVRPILDYIDSAEATIALSPSPVSERASESSQDLGSFERRASIVPQESQSPKRSGSASSITSIDADSASTVDKAKMRPTMPPLISIPVPLPVPAASPYPNSAIKQPPAQAEPECKPNAARIEELAPIVVSNDLPTNDIPAKPNTTVKPSSSRIMDGFSPLRWFGFGASSAPSTEVKSVESKPVDALPARLNDTESKPCEVEPVTVKAMGVAPMEVEPVVTAVKLAEVKPTKGKLTETVAIESNPIVARPVEISAVASSNLKAAGDRERQPKVTLVPIRKAASPESPAMEKTVWSRWPHQPAMITSIPPVRSKVPLARDSVATATRPDSQTTPPKPNRAPTASTMPPIIPVVSMGAVHSSAQTKVDSPRSRRPPRVDGVTLPIPQAPAHAQGNFTNEKSERPANRPSGMARVASPTLNIPSVAFQSPHSSEDSLPAYTPQAPNVDREPKPALRGILKQRGASLATLPTTDPPATNSPRVTPQASKFEAIGSSNAPVYDNWNHTSPARRGASTNTVVPRSREVPVPSTMTPPSSRNRTTGDPNHRSRSKHTSKELDSVTNKTNRPRTPSPSRETKATSKITEPPKPNLVPVLNDKIIRSKASKPAKISTTRATGDVYIQPLTSPILLTSENYGTRQPENNVYQYDVRISPSESLSPASRKAIFDIFQKQVAPQIFPALARPSFDGKKMLYANRRLNVSSRQEFMVELPESGQEAQVYIVQLKKIAVITPQFAPAFR
ncbi:unnamed protein product [Rhizoctonia solani]|uniref:Protein argonaute N-terminal domain-containing protein n=1 Tax=Rhizoctonia solani TaxID=456999 RepID=A0A8H3GMI3_9AGAM|nr:unnamed protein product [Rhizoctonia solani]